MTKCEELRQQTKQLQRKNEVLHQDLKELQQQLQEHEVLFRQT